MKAEDAWEAVLGQLQMEMPRASYTTWVRDTVVETYEDGQFVIGVRNAYARDWLESRLASTAVRLLGGIMNRTCDVRFVVTTGASFCDDEDTVREKADVPRRCDNLTLNTRLTFESLVVGHFNRLAVEVGKALAEMPGRYNPVYVYGRPGLGKTHLLHAVGNALAACKSESQILYVTAEEFTNDLVTAILGRTTLSLRERYRGLDLLLIDDFQFIGGKKATLEEFHHTLDVLLRKGAQVIIAADRPSKDITDIDKATLSRIQGGLSIDVSVPTEEDLAQIIQNRVKIQGVSMAEETILLIARTVSDIRELLGAVNKVTAMTNFLGTPPSPDYICSVLLEDSVTSGDVLKAECVIAAVSESFEISVEAILSGERLREYVVARYIAMLLVSEFTHASLVHIGRVFGNRDHTSVMYGITSARKRLAKDATLEQQVGLIRERLKKESSSGSKKKETNRARHAK